MSDGYHDDDDDDDMMVIMMIIAMMTVVVAMLAMNQYFKQDNHAIHSVRKLEKTFLRWPALQVEQSALRFRNKSLNTKFASSYCHHVVYKSPCKREVIFRCWNLFSAIASGESLLLSVVELPVAGSLSDW